jgi:hypothetical protein
MWVMFDPIDRINRAPDFSLVTHSGGRVCLNDYYERTNLIIFFQGRANVAAIDLIVDGLLSWSGSENRFQLSILLVLTGDQAIPHPIQSDRSNPPEIAVDPGRMVRSRYSKLVELDLGNESLLFILDQYGCPYALWIGEAVDWQVLRDDIEHWLDYIEIQCPE